MKEQILMIGGPSDGLAHEIDEDLYYLKVKILPTSPDLMTELQAIRARAGQPFEITLAIYERDTEDRTKFEHIAYERAIHTPEGGSDESEEIPF